MGIFGSSVTDIFSSQASNLGRQPEVDLARGFAAVLIIIVHVGLFLGNGISQGVWIFCDIIGSEPCAPVFMTLMGISMAYSRRQRPAELWRRGIRLFGMGYLLNFFRSLLPLLIVGKVDDWSSAGAFLVVDILQFAGLSFVLIALLKQLRLPNLGILALSLAMCATDQFIMLPETVPWNSELLTGQVNLFCPVTQWSCFPLLTWFVFPAFGLVYGDMLTHCTCKNRLYGVLMPVSLVGTAYVYYQFFALYPDYTSHYWGNNFYYMGVQDVLLTLLIICFTLSCWFFAEKIVPEPLKKFLKFLSVNLTVFYFISWLLISILLHAQALRGWKFGTGTTLMLMVFLTIGCAWMTKLWLSAKRAIQKVGTP